MIRSELDVLLDKIEDDALRADVRTQIDRLKQRRSFGLVFEQHIPERVRLPQHPIRVGSQVVSRDDDNSPTFEVIAIQDGLATLVLVRDADGAYVQRGEHAVGGHERVPVDSLVVMSDFGEPVLPGFRYLGGVERGGDKPYHVVINGENHHALEALRFTHAGRIDCIYIDPPYNSGARDWKYDNDYVDDADAYRHSKWLAFMERRLKLANELLHPDDSVLIVTVDENEVHRLGMLLSQIFPADSVQMVSSVINPASSSRRSEFGRSNEFAFFVSLGAAKPQPVELGEAWFGKTSGKRKHKIRWQELSRRGDNGRRSARPNLFYPIFVRADGSRVHSVGEPIPIDADHPAVPAPEATVAIWPIRSDGSHGTWGRSAGSLRSAVERGFVRLGGFTPRGMAVYHMARGEQEKVEQGVFKVIGHAVDGSVIVDDADYRSAIVPGTQWDIPSHDASTYGSGLLRTVIPGRRFPFPKSLYAVEDTIRFFVKDKPNATVVDFFAGSGTTAHAVMRLNRQDGGRRQSIMVTNNEVSADEAADLRAKGRRPGDGEWEALGIFEHITRPRVTAAITGRTPDGEAIKGDYKFTDEFPMADGIEENAAFLELRYLDADDVDLGLSYDDIAPLLWLRAGATGPIAPRTDDAGNPVPFAWTDRYGVLFDEDRWRAFVSARPESARAAFIVTHSPTTFAGIAAELPTDMDTVRLYDTYLSMFLPERGRA